MYLRGEDELGDELLEQVHVEGELPRLGDRWQRGETQEGALLAPTLLRNGWAGGELERAEVG
jgi:hypothetical protein